MVSFNKQVIILIYWPRRLEESINTTTNSTSLPKRIEGNVFHHIQHFVLSTKVCVTGVEEVTNVVSALDLCFIAL